MQQTFITQFSHCFSSVSHQYYFPVASYRLLFRDEEATFKNNCSNKNNFAVLNTNKYINKHYSSGDFSLKVRKVKDLFNMKGHIKCSLQQDKNQQKQTKAQRSEMQEQLCGQSGPPTPGRPCTKVFSKERPRKEWLEHNLYLPGWRKLRGLSYTLVHLALPVP